MPFRSEAQRRFMWSQHPDIAERWVKEGKGNVEQKYGIKTSGTTMSNNAPVGGAGNPSSTDPASKGGGMRSRPMPKEKSAAIERRMQRMNKKGK